jgi:hypothetical protein
VRLETKKLEGFAFEALMKILAMTGPRFWVSGAGKSLFAETRGKYDIQLIKPKAPCMERARQLHSFGFDV